DFRPDLILSQRRLAIIDLSAGGHEPMTVAGEQLWLTFNGEIYNYLEIREELRAKGYQFRTECDAEVILQAYDCWGVDCLSRFIGMFAFVLWDQQRQRVWCVRDRLGIKPFYYAVVNDRFAFASEIKALKPLIPEACTPDMSQLFWFLQYGRVYNPPHTFFEGVRELPGGHYLLIENGRVSDPIRWWDVDIEQARATYNYNDIDGEFLRILRDSVALRLRADVPVGTCLSGGLDSSTIVALATAGLDGGSMNSFSAVYPVKGLDESRYVDIVAQRYHTIEHRVTPDPTNFLDRLAKITWHQDIPTATSGVYTQNFVMQLAHGSVTVLLDGQGADELMAGYLSYVVYHLNDLRRRNFGKWVGEQAAFATGVWPRFNAQLNAREFAARVQQYFTGNRPLLQPQYAQAAQAREAEALPLEPKGIDSLNRHLYKALLRESIPALLHYEDRNSMAYGIEARVPFLDHRLVEFALAVPAEQKIQGADTKVFMRRALKDVLPPEVSNRKDKLGYPTPFGQWLRGPLRGEVNSFLNDRVFKREWYDQAAVRALWQAHLSEQRNAERTIYSLITADLWYSALVA
ncbi:MAG TPA: asparagine synthase (glutamine-hydrolyzing), partial [Phototrophicaceae bacterium]|nr:asparagine synthase (glutamine-hydrolyzing) [Phototrophicaceae bacterium]